MQEALDDLRDELGDEPLRLSELVILGAREKLARVRAAREDTAGLRRRLAERIRSREPLTDPAAADEVRRLGWTRS